MRQIKLIKLVLFSFNTCDIFDRCPQDLNHLTKNDKELH